MKIKFDKRNYRKHNDKNKKLIKKSLNECGAGRSIVVDNEGEIIGGNGIYEAWGNKPIKVIETDGSELVVVKRTDLNTNDEKRKKLAIMDNSTSDSSEFDFDMLHADFDLNQLSEFGLPVEFEGIESYNNNNIVQPNGEQTIQDIVENLPDELGMRFYVSDSHFKELSCNGSCCGLPQCWNYSRGQWTEALLLAKKNGSVRYSEIRSDIDKYLSGFQWWKGEGFNRGSSENRARLDGMTMADLMRYRWNSPQDGQSPYKLFEGVLVPNGKDENGDLIYVYNKSRSL